MDFSEWLLRELENRKMTQSDLARAANLTTGGVTHLINRSRKPNPATCQAIADAFNLPDETVFRAAGILDPVPALEEEAAKLLNDFRQLPDRDRAEIQALVDFKLQQVKLEIERQRAAHRNSPGPLPKMG